MADQVKEIKSKADIVALISERVKLKKAGRNFQGLCPFHSEKTPSFNVSPELQIYKCFGCGESGDVFEFLEKFEGMDFPEALRHMADKVGVKLEVFKPGKNYAAKERLREILSLTAEFYHFILKEHKVGKAARGYIKERGIWKSTVDKFQLGYAPDSFEALFKYLVKKKKYSVAELMNAGLVVKGGRGGYYDRFRGRIMFPLTNHRAQVLGFSGRVLDKEIKQAKYINSPETGLYHKSELLYGLAVTKSEVKRKDKVIVVEGELDVLSSWQAGVKNVVAIKGSAFTEDQLRLILRFTNNVLLALDADSAGDEAAKRGIGLADKMGVNVRVVCLPDNQDPDEIARKDKKVWQKLVGKSVSVYDFYLESAIKKWGADSGEGKRRVSQDLAPIWAKISNQVEKAHYTLKLAKALKVSELVVSKEIERVIKGMDVDGSDERKPMKSGEENRVVDEYVLGLLMKSGDKVVSWKNRIKKKWFKSLGIKRLYGKMADFKGGAGVGKWVEGLPAELRALAEKIWMTDDLGMSSSEREKELDKAIAQMRKRYLKAQMNKLAAKIEELEAGGDRNEAKLSKLRQEFVKVAKVV